MNYDTQTNKKQKKKKIERHWRKFKRMIKFCKKKDN